MQSNPSQSIGVNPPNANPFTDYAITHRLTPFISMQNHYSLVYREEEREMSPTLQVTTALDISCSEFDVFPSTLALDRSLGRHSRAGCSLGRCLSRRREETPIGMRYFLPLDHGLIVFVLRVNEGYKKNDSTSTIINRFVFSSASLYSNSPAGSKKLRRRRV